ncbi:MAG: Asp-tRNA(Asn)/Glu-tRNA(Gln) amidotransferase subunit GatC [alpha proteobacterium HIMB114]|nr:MAG: Asp-tRNA(Asn)/Glu-tRNA(Gln) amidotransferase subunit GatC [alpha proteobacterium HIMB114]
MSITKDTVKKISKLSRIASNEKFEDNMIKDLNAILKFVEQLNEVTIDNVEPLNSTVDQELIKRDDTVSLMNEKKDILSNSPEDNDDFYVVPKVIE